MCDVMAKHNNNKPKPFRFTHSGGPNAGGFPFAHSSFLSLDFSVVDDFSAERKLNFDSSLYFVLVFFYIIYLCFSFRLTAPAQTTCIRKRNKRNNKKSYREKYENLFMIARAKQMVKNSLRSPKPKCGW